CQKNSKRPRFTTRNSRFAAASPRIDSAESRPLRCFPISAIPLRMTRSRRWSPAEPDHLITSSESSPSTSTASLSPGPRRGCNGGLDDNSQGVWTRQGGLLNPGGGKAAWHRPNPALRVHSERRPAPGQALQEKSHSGGRDGSAAGQVAS